MPALESFRRRATLVIIGGNVVMLSSLVALGWPEWWVNINYERAPLTWFSSVQLVLLGVAALANAGLARLPSVEVSLPKEQSRLWAVLALAFAYLALDERFEVHERLREGVFKPHEIGTHLPGIGAGDFLPLLYAAAGLLVAWRLFLYVRGDRGTRATLALAIGVALLAVIMDSIDLHRFAPGILRYEQFVEEIAETLGQMLFLVTFVRHGARLLSGVELVTRADGGSVRPR